MGWAAGFGSELLCSHGSAFMLGAGKEMAHGGSIGPREASPCMLPLQGHTPRRVNNLLCAPGVLQIPVSTPSASRSFACLLSRSWGVSSGLYPSHTDTHLKL